MWFSIGVDLLGELRAMTSEIRDIMTTAVDQVRADYKAYATDLKAQRDAALALADRAVAEKQSAIDALQSFQDDDATTDAQQLLDQQAADAAAFKSDLDDLKGQDVPAPSDPEPTPAPETPADPPVDDGGTVADVPVEDTEE